MSVKEKVIEKYLKEQVEAAGGMCIKFTGQKDVPDRIVILGGMTVFVEVKAEGEEPRPSQVRMFTKMMACGAFVFLIDSKISADKFVEFLLDPEEEEDAPRIQLLNS